MPKTNERYCLHCEKLGHYTSDCWSTHGLNHPADLELSRLTRIDHEMRALAATAPNAGAPLAEASNDMRDAYAGAREDLLDWKKRALKAEELVRKFTREVNGATFMGEPAQQSDAPLPALTTDQFKALRAILDASMCGMTDAHTATPTSVESWELAAEAIDALAAAAAPAQQAGAPLPLAPSDADAASAEMIAAGLRAATSMDSVLSTLYPSKLQAIYRTMREALMTARDHISMDQLRISHCKDAAAIEAALATPPQATLPASEAEPIAWLTADLRRVVSNHVLKKARRGDAFGVISGALAAYCVPAFRAATHAQPQADAAEPVAKGGV